MTIATLDVAVIGQTYVDFEGMDGATDLAYASNVNDHDADALAEFAGRACYQSWDRPNPKTADVTGYVGHILDVNHQSVLEHATVTFYLQGVSRSLTHELVRHRHLSFSQLSQRYVDEADARYVVPPALRGNRKALGYLEDNWQQVLFIYRSLVEELTAQGLPRKEARQTARSVLPNMTETKIVVSGNHRSWREFLIKRGGAAADTEIRELAVTIFDLLKEIAPAIYQDFHSFSLGDGKNIGVVQA